MVLPPFIYLLVDKLKTGGNWLKAYLKDNEGETKEISSENISKIQSVSSGRDTNINNYFLNIVIDKDSSNYSGDQVGEILKQASKDVSSHSGIAIGFDRGMTIARQTKLDQRQTNHIKLFRNAGWSKDKIMSIRTAYKIINLEDSGSYEKANQLMESAFNGTKREQNRKLYNLARSGYLEGFAFNIMMSAEMHSDKAISKVLDYFPEAIFMDLDFSANDMIMELEERLKNGIHRVSVFARGLKRIEVMEMGYNNYIDWKTSKGYKPKEKIRIYGIDSKIKYKLGDSEAQRIDLSPMDLVIKDSRD